MSNRLTAMLARCRQQFLFYGDQHKRKDPPQEEKAQVNYDLASEISEVLAVRLPDDLHTEMVERLQKPGEDILARMTALQADCLHMAIGICGEAGELADAIKKWAIYGKDLDLTNVIEELGDLEFFLQGLRRRLALTREETLEANMLKLEKGKNARYKDGYSDAAAIARADKRTEEADNEAWMREGVAPFPGAETNS